MSQLQQHYGASFSMKTHPQIVLTIVPIILGRFIVWNYSISLFVVEIASNIKRSKKFQEKKKTEGQVWRRNVRIKNVLWQ